MKKRLGQFLFILSFAIYGIVLLVPFAPLSASSKILLSSILVLLAESSFWLSVLILGRQIIRSYKKFSLRRWLGYGPRVLDEQEDKASFDICPSREQPGGCTSQEVVREE